PTPLARPPSAPFGLVVGVPAVPEGVAHGHQRPAEGAGADVLTQPGGAGTEPVLEDVGGVRPTVAFQRGDLVVLGEREHRRLLTPDVDTGLQAGDDRVAVRPGRGADDGEVELLHGEQLGDRAVAVRDLPGLREGTGTVGVDVRHRDDLEPAVQLAHRRHVASAGDTTGTYESYPDRSVLHCDPSLRAESAITRDETGTCIVPGFRAAYDRIRSVPRPVSTLWKRLPGRDRGRPSNNSADGGL